MSTSTHTQTPGVAIVSPEEKQAAVSFAGQDLQGQLLTLTQSLSYQHSTVYSVNPKALAAVSQTLRLRFEPTRNWLTSHELSKIIQTALDSGQLENIAPEAKQALLKTGGYLSVLNHVKAGQIGFDKQCLPNSTEITNPSIKTAVADMKIKDLQGNNSDTLASTDTSSCEKLTEGIAHFLTSSLQGNQSAKPNQAATPAANKQTAAATFSTQTAPSLPPQIIEQKTETTTDNNRRTRQNTTPSEAHFKKSKTPSKPVNLNHEQSAIVYNKKMEILNALAYNGIISIDIKPGNGMVDMKKTFENLRKDNSSFFVMTLFFMEGVDRDALKDGTDKANGYLNISECLYRIAGYEGSPQELAQKAQNARPTEAVKVIDQALKRATEELGQEAGTELVIRAIRGGSTAAGMNSGTALVNPNESINSKLQKLRIENAYDSNRYLEVFNTFQATIKENPSYMYDDTRLWEHVSYQA